jgi:uncharacterized YigZ family protein
LSESREYITIANSAESSVNIKGSEFISRCARVTNASEAMTYIQSVRAQHSDATHNCWAYRISPSEYRFNDDGEPSGTAGQPIFQAILGLDLEQTCVVVTRYYGGVKLGTGGLARAYGGGAAAVLKLAQTLIVKPKITLLIEVPFSEQNTLYHFLKSHPEITILSTDYTSSGLQLKLELYLFEHNKLIELLNNTLRGLVEIIII